MGAPPGAGDRGAAAAAAPAPAAGAPATGAGLAGRLPIVSRGLASSIGDTPAIGEVRRTLVGRAGVAGACPLITPSQHSFKD